MALLIVQARERLRSPALHRYAIFVAVCVLAVLGVGAYFTSNIRPLPGPNPGPLLEAPGLRQIHLILAVAVSLLVVVLAIWARSSSGWITLAILIVEGGLGSFSAVFHAIVAPILFSSAVAIAVVTSESRRRPPVRATDFWPPLRTLAWLVPVLVVIQISLGAAFRHNAMGVVWHILNAGIVLLLIMVLGVCILRQYPEHPTLRPAAIWMVVIAGVQVFLGFTVYLILIIVSQNNMALIVSGALHVITGSLTLAAAVVMALELRRCDTATDESMTGA
jgi:heme A synthase